VFAAANFRQSAPATCGFAPVREVVSSLSFTRAMVGGGLFNIDGELLGVILPCRDHIVAIDTTSVDNILRRADTVEERLLARYGIAFSRLSEEEQRYFKGIDGLLVREVWIGALGDGTGLWPGDIITALNRKAVATIDDLRALMAPPETPFELRVRRGARNLTFALVSSSIRPGLTVPAPDAGLVLDSSLKTYRIESVVPGSRAAAAGIEPGDRLVRINRAELRNLEQVQRTMTARKAAPMLLEIQRDARRIAIVMPEATHGE
jgi:S1-C subfamily serine protease